VTIGLATLLPGPDGVRLVDTASFPAQYRPFSLAHASGLEILRAESGGLDWLCLSPAGDFDRDGARTGRYTIGEHVRTETRVSYADFAIALIDEADSARHHRSQLAVS
jgi:putative NADH-flavin reductase